MSDVSSDTGSVPEKTDTSAQSDVTPVRNISAVQGIADNDSAAQAFRDVKSNAAFTKDVEDFQKSPALNGISEETKQKYFDEKMKKLEADASDQSKVVVQDLKNKNPEKIATFEALDKEFGENEAKKLEVIDGFTEIPALKTIQEPELAYRNFGGPGEYGKWMSPTNYDNIKERQEKLSLPDSNAGVFADRYELETGRQVLSGNACAKFGHAGGGEQYYVLGQGRLNRV